MLAHGLLVQLQHHVYVSLPCRRSSVAKYVEKHELTTPSIGPFKRCLRLLRRGLTFEELKWRMNTSTEQLEKFLAEHTEAVFTVCSHLLAHLLFARFLVGCFLHIFLVIFLIVSAETTTGAAREGARPPARCVVSENEVEGVQCTRQRKQS